jgi:hypothetical protein
MVIRINGFEYPVRYANTVVHYRDAEPYFNFFVSIASGPNDFEAISYALTDPERITLYTDDDTEYSFSSYTPEECMQNYGDDGASTIEIHMVKPLEPGDDELFVDAPPMENFDEDEPEA